MLNLGCSQMTLGLREMLFKDNESAKVVGDSGALRHTTDKIAIAVAFLVDLFKAH